jgi:hypothetical protein
MAAAGIERMKNAAFPFYAVRPSQWTGDVMIGGGWGPDGHPLSIWLRYQDDLMVEWPSRLFEIVSTGSEGLGHRAPMDVDLGGEFSYPNEIRNFVNWFTKLQDRPVPGSERFNADMVDGKLVPKTVYLPSTGPRRLLPTRPFGDGGEIEPVVFDEHSQLRCYRVRLPEVEVIAMGWGYDDHYLSSLIAAMRPVDHDAETLDELERAQRASWEKIRARKRRRKSEEGDG